VTIRYAGKLAGKWDVYVDDEMKPGQILVFGAPDHVHVPPGGSVQSWAEISLADVKAKRDEMRRRRMSSMGTEPETRGMPFPDDTEPSGTEHLEHEGGKPIDKELPWTAEDLIDNVELGAFEELGLMIGQLVERKNKAYGDSFEKACKLLEILYPDGVKPDQYLDMLALVRLIDKMFRIANDKGAFDEDPWADIAGYGILGMRSKRKDKDLAF